MKKNMAVLDRILRGLLAIAGFLLFFGGGIASPWNYIMLLVGIVFLATAYWGSCPLYTLFGIDTRQFRDVPRA